MNLDKVTITIKSGNGGSGKVSFHREKFVEKGGPDGGDGGHGGSVFFVADKDKNTLIDFQYTKKFEAENGEGGGGRLQFGKNGKDIYIKVPCGTVIILPQHFGVVNNKFVGNLHFFSFCRCNSLQVSYTNVSSCSTRTYFPPVSSDKKPLTRSASSGSE